MLVPVLTQDLEEGLLIQIPENRMALGHEQEQEQEQAQGLKQEVVFSVGQVWEDAIAFVRILVKHDW